VIVPLKAGEAIAGTGSSGSATAAPNAPISLGSATAEQLDTLDGVGPATAEKIIQWRTEHGGFTSVDDLGEVPGIGPKKLEALRSQVTP
jgi:competence protein ComEA